MYCTTMTYIVQYDSTNPALTNEYYYPNKLYTTF